MAAAETLALHQSVPPESVAALAGICAKLQARPELRSLIFYGSVVRGGFTPGVSDVNLLIIVEKVDAAMLWSMEATFDELPESVRLSPYLVTQAEWPHVVRAFPTRLMEMKRGHLVVHGDDVLAATQVDRADLEVRCRQELLNVVLRFRHQMLGSDDPECLERDLRGYLPPLVKTLRSLLWVRKGEYFDTREQVLRAAAQEFHLPLEPLLQFSEWRSGRVAFSGDEYRQAASAFLEILLQLVKAVG